MKPSERIKEIFNSKGKAFSSERIIARSLDAVIQYLDEEYERNKPKEELKQCIHEYTEDFELHKCILCGEHDGYSRYCGMEYCKCAE